MAKHYDLTPLSEINEGEYNQLRIDRLNREALVADSIIQLSLRPPKVLRVPALFWRGFVHVERVIKHDKFIDLEAFIGTTNGPRRSSITVNKDNLITSPVQGKSGLHEVGYFSAALVDSDLDEFLRSAMNDLSIHA